MFKVTVPILVCVHVNDTITLLDIALIFTAKVPNVATQRIQLSGTISDGEAVCPGNTITFTCETTGSGTLAWASDEYIGQGTQFEFSAIDNLDVTHESTISNTIATFISKMSVGGIPVLVSRLRVTVLDTVQNPSIACIHVTDDTRNVTRFQLHGTLF